MDPVRCSLHLVPSDGSEKPQRLFRVSDRSPIISDNIPTGSCEYAEQDVAVPTRPHQGEPRRWLDSTQSNIEPASSRLNSQLYHDYTTS